MDNYVYLDLILKARQIPYTTDRFQIDFDLWRIVSLLVDDVRERWSPNA